jgi:type 1 glutamine amidotransferase
MRKALVVRGGWEGHSPVRATEMFLPGLADAGFDVEIAEDLDVYTDAGKLAATDLIVQCWSMGKLTPAQCDGLVSAVRGGTGFAGWHGGVVATFQDSPDYLRMVGGLFLYHPPEFLDYEVRIARAQSGHPIVAGLPDFTVHTEQYWMLSDSLNTVLATTEFGPPEQPVTMPVAWTRNWGAGRIFFSAIGHRTEDLWDPAVYTLTHRGLVWASRQVVQ